MNATKQTNLLQPFSAQRVGWMAVGAAWQANSRHCHSCDYLDRFEGAPGESLTSCGLNAGRGTFSDCPAVQAKQEAEAHA